MGRYRGARSVPASAVSATDLEPGRDDRLAEVAEILARGYLRLTARAPGEATHGAQTADPARPEKLSESAQISLDVSAPAVMNVDEGSGERRLAG